MLLIMASPIPVCDHKLPRCNGKTCMSLIDHHSTKVPDCHMKIVFALCKASLRKSVIGVSYFTFTTCCCLQWLFANVWVLSLDPEFLSISLSLQNRKLWSYANSRIFVLFYSMAPDENLPWIKKNNWWVVGGLWEL